MTIRYSRHQRTANPPWQDGPDIFESIIETSGYSPAGSRDMFRSRSYAGVSTQLMEAVAAYIAILKEYADSIGASAVSRALSKKVTNLEDAFYLNKALAALPESAWQSVALKRSALDVFGLFVDIKEPERWSDSQEYIDVPYTEIALRGDSLINKISSGISVGLKQIELDTGGGSSRPGTQAFFRNLGI